MRLFEKLNFRSVAKSLAYFAVAGILYYIAARVGLHTATINKFSSPVWPATGIAAWTVFLGGWPAALGTLIGSFFANYDNGFAFAPCLIIAIGNTTEAVAGVWLFRFLLKYKEEYGLHSRAIFVIFTIAVATTISATFGTFALLSYHLIEIDTAFKNWTTWWIGDVIGSLFLIPFAYKLYIVRLAPIAAIRKNIMKLIFLFAFTALLNFFVFETSFGPGFLFVIFLPLLLAAIWMDSFWTHVLSLLTCVWAILATIDGSGPFIGNSINDNLVHLQLFLMGLGITALGLGSLRQESLHQRTVIALLSGWILSGLSFYSFFNSNTEIDRNRFIIKSEQAELAIQSRLKDYISLLDSGAGLFNASKFVSKSEWATFIERFILNEDYASIETISVAFATDTLDKKAFLKRHHIENEVPDIEFKVVTRRKKSHIVTDPDVNVIITYVEPYATKKKVVGLNLSSEKNRYEALIRARDTGRASASGHIHLTVDKTARPAFLLFTPLYNNGAPIATPNQRKAAFKGVIYAPIIFDKFIASAIDKFSDEVHLTASYEFDDPKQAPQIVFESKSETLNSQPKIVKQSKLGGQPITYTWRKASAFQPTSSLVFALISFLGSVISLLLAMMLSTLQNLTLRAQALAKAQTIEIVAQNRIWKLLTDTSPVGIFLTDAKGKCTYVNPMWGKLTGRSCELAIGDQWMEAIHQEDFEIVLQSWKELIRGGDFDCHFRFLQPDLTTLNVWTKAVTLVNELGVVIGYLGIIQDMTDSVEKNNVLLASSRMSSLGEMASGIAHEINNPLSIILGNADLLAAHLDSATINVPRAKHHLNQLTVTTQRIAKIIRGLSAFARETSKEPFETCCLKDVIEDTLEFCRERFNSHGVELILPEHIDPKLYFWGRSEQIAQVLLNLLNNGFDAAIDSSEKWLEISFKTTVGKIQILITDSGLGIEASRMQKIFEPFYTSKKVGHGTGLGLSISKGIIEHHHGKLFLDKSANHTTFVVELEQHTAEPRKDIDFV